MKCKAKSNFVNLRASTSSLVNFQDSTASLHSGDGQTLACDLSLVLPVAFEFVGKFISAFWDHADIRYRAIDDSIAEQLKNPDFSFNEKKQLLEMQQENAKKWDKDFTFRQVLSASLSCIALLAVLAVVVRFIRFK